MKKNEFFVRWTKGQKNSIQSIFVKIWKKSNFREKKIIQKRKKWKFCSDTTIMPINFFEFSQEKFNHGHQTTVEPSKEDGPAFFLTGPHQAVEACPKYEKNYFLFPKKNFYFKKKLLNFLIWAKLQTLSFLEIFYIGFKMLK